MAEFIFAELSTVCDTPKIGLDPLTAFIAKVRRDHITRIYTTNYDDFFLQAAPDLYTGFDLAPSPDAKSFDGGDFWKSLDSDCLYHLHGSVHLVAGPPLSTDKQLGALHWFDSRAEALKKSPTNASDIRLMDGRQVVRTAVITGLDKLSRLQQQPLSHYYASLSRDALTADIIYVVGSGLSDLHLNTWLGEARSKTVSPPMIFVDWWPNSFLQDTNFQLDRKHIEMMHKLRMRVGGGHYPGDLYGNGWTLAKDRSCAVWDKGFLSFLKAPNELDHILSQLS
jgi:hypothetical protein